MGRGVRVLLGGCLSLVIVVTLGGRLSAALIGSYEVGDGPDYATNPPTYSCLEACALLFGGTATDYSCSTNGAFINQKAFVSGWGDDQFCITPADEAFKKNDFYDCGQEECAYSAYVDDHCTSGETNYCFAASLSNAPAPTMSSYALSTAALLLLAFGFIRVRRLRTTP